MIAAAMGDHRAISTATRIGASATRVLQRLLSIWPLLHAAGATGEGSPQPVRLAAGPRRAWRALLAAGAGGDRRFALPLPLARVAGRRMLLLFPVFFGLGSAGHELLA